MLRAAASFTKAFFTIGFGLAIALQPTQLLAGSITWTIDSNAYMRGGALVTGSFQYDAGTGIYSAVDVSITSDLTGVGTIPADTYTTGEIAFTDSQHLFLNDSSAQTELDLFFFSPLTDTPGTDNLGIHLQAAGYGVVDVEAGGGSYNDLVTGIDPEPSTVLSLLLGLAALGWMKVRRGTSSASK